MNTKPIYISRHDYTRLKKLVGGLSESGAKNKSLLSLRAELERANVVDPSAISSDTVTLDSRVTIRDLDSEETETYTLVSPEDAHGDDGRISVMAPVGTALLGYSAGDLVEWETPGGLRHIRIETVSRSEPKKSIIPPYFPEHLLARRSTA